MHFRSASISNCFRLHRTMGLSRTVSEIDGDFSWKSQSFPPPCILRPLELGTGAGSEMKKTYKNIFCGKCKYPNQLHNLDYRIQRRAIFATKIVSDCHLVVKWSCEAGGSPEEATLEQTPYPFPTHLIWRYLCIK